jgi:hypothetical protein
MGYGVRPVVFEAALMFIRLDAIPVIDHSRVGDYLVTGLGEGRF